MGLFDTLFGRKPSIEQLPTMDPQQQQLLQQLLGGLGGPLQAGLGNIQGLLSGDPEALEAFQAPALRQFQEQIVPGIAERFTGAGAGAQRSSAFGQQLGAAGAGLSEALSGQRAGLQSQALGQLSQLLGLGIQQRPFGFMQTPGTSGFLGGLAPGIGAGFGGGLSRLFGGGF